MTGWCRKLSFFILFCLCAGVAAANNGESSRLLVHMLNYLGQDYRHAVSNGKVISEDEYEEQLEFCESTEKYFKQFSTAWSDADSAEVGVMVYDVIKGVRTKADPAYVSKRAAEAKAKIVAITGLSTFPAKYPDVQQGQKLFVTECVKCHGKEGYGDGPEGVELNPRPRNFHDEEKMEGISPSHIFNTVRLGIEGTGMKAHPDLNDAQVWNLAFYVLTLRYKNEKGTAPYNNGALTLEKIATTSDEDLEEDYGLTKAQIGGIRWQQPETTHDNFLKIADSYLQQAAEAYQDISLKNGRDKALQLATLAYLEGIEPIELHLKANDPELSERLEKQITAIKKMIDRNRSETEVADSINAARQTLLEAGKLMEKKEYSFWWAFFMSVSILLREGLEAFLVILVILTILKASNLRRAQIWVHGGWVIAILAGYIIWSVAGKVLPNSVTSNKEILEGAISIIAVLMLLYIGFWLHNKSEIGKWKDYVQQKLKNAATSGNLFGLALLSFFVVFREVFESMLFLSTLTIENGGKHSDALVAGIITAFAIVFVFAFFVLRFSARLPIPKLFKISAFVMALMAFILAGKGVHAFQEINYLPVHGLPLPRIELLGLYPTVETTVAQVLTLLLVWGLGKWGSRKK